MKREHHQQLVDQQIEGAMEHMFPHGAGRTNHTRVKHHLDTVAQVAFREGRSYALMSLMSAEEAAEELGVTVRRVRAIAKWRHERGFPLGSKIGGRWIFTPECVEGMRERPAGGPWSPAAP